MDDHSPLRLLPPIGRLLNQPAVALLLKKHPRRAVIDSLRAEVDRLRKKLLDPATTDEAQSARSDPDAAATAIAERAALRLERSEAPYYRKVVNAAGIVLHTGLGRAVLPRKALDQVRNELAGYNLLQQATDTGGRGRRDARIEELLQRLTGAEAATVVNNNAAATAIVLNTVGAGREIIVSRGQLVEIGGAFRLPDVMRTSGVRLVEVGSTNKTHLRDYAEAIGDDTAAILRVHPSNYVIKGFTSEVPTRELAELAHAKGIVMIDDVGAGCLVDVTRFGFRKEPTLPEAIAAGADLVLSSADKLIGGPQGGIIMGRSDLIGRIRKNPWARIVRVDKMTLAALEATLTLFLDEDTALREVPTFQMLLRPPAELARQARRMAQAIKRAHVPADVDTREGFSQMGSGSLPDQDLPTRVVAIVPNEFEPGELARRLRNHPTPVFARVHEGALLIDPRTLQDGEDKIVIEAVVAALSDQAEGTAP